VAPRSTLLRSLPGLLQSLHVGPPSLSKG
jgi:hypothetical protein